MGMGPTRCAGSWKDEPRLVPVDSCSRCQKSAPGWLGAVDTEHRFRRAASSRRDSRRTSGRPPGGVLALRRGTLEPSKLGGFLSEDLGALYGQDIAFTRVLHDERPRADHAMRRDGDAISERGVDTDETMVADSHVA